MMNKISNRQIQPKKNPRTLRSGGLGLGAWQCPTFAWGSTLSSALGGFTSEVGMGSGGSRPPWPPGNSVWRPRLGGAAGVRSGSVLANVGVSRRRLRRRARRRPLGRCMAKPRGQLVPVSFARCRASTPGLSTSWSARALRGTRGPREVSSWEGLPA